ncbi:DUF2187 family protein [Ferdinandcohnia sp. SAFN-114]|uniref:DUF2187 family protein n=1 Tax=Ferdinandcohnia sp. SAFN-114 TaxID=3387275 RepID=UPI003F7F61D0
MAKSKVNKKDIARVGDTIQFTRREHHFLAVVINVIENSVIVELQNRKDKDILEIETERTVVAHSNYEISSRIPCPREPIPALDPWTYGWKTSS